MTISLIIYKKYINDDLVFNIITSYPIFKKVGDTNGYGWTILSVQCYINGRFYNIDTYREIIQNIINNKQKRNLIKKKHFNILQFIYDLTR